MNRCAKCDEYESIIGRLVLRRWRIAYEHKRTPYTKRFLLADNAHHQELLRQSWTAHQVQDHPT
jgi:hypothetical protein